METTVMRSMRLGFEHSTAWERERRWPAWVEQKVRMERRPGATKVVFHGLQGVFVAVHADMSDFGGGDEIEDSADHAEAGAENGDEQDLFGQLQGVAGGEGGVDADGPQGEIAGDFIDQQVGEFLQRGAEQLVVGLAVAENGELVLDQGVFQNSDSGAHGAVPPIGSET
jgi:hypothetical protein